MRRGPHNFLRRIEKGRGGVRRGEEGRGVARRARVLILMLTSI